MPTLPRLSTLVALVALLGGCATLTPDAGFSSVQEAARSQLDKKLSWARQADERQAIREQIAPLLAQPLSADDAVQIALLNNPGLQATFGELGIADANRVQAGRLRNPGFTFARLQRNGEAGEIVDIERKFLFDILGLLTLPTRSELETRRFHLTQQRVTQEVMRLALDTRRAWVEAVAAQETVRYLEDVRAAAEAGAELARRMAAAGNLNRLDQTRQQVFYAETLAQLARARQQASSTRERLARLMGLWGEDLRFQLPDRLPDLPSKVREPRELEATAIERRIDIAMARRELEGLAQSLGLTRATRFVNVLETSYLRNSTTGEPRQTGYEIELSIPLFDFGEAKVARAEATYLQAANRLAELAVNARSEVREAYGAYRTAYDLARHYREEIVPLRRQISEENLLRYNGMLIGVFELLSDARSQMAAVNASIEALRDFWLAETDLEAAMTAGGVRGAGLRAGGMAAGAETGGGH